MPTGISRLGARGRREWVASVFATVKREQHPKPAVELAEMVNATGLAKKP
jgi:hypothetical protein